MKKPPIREESAGAGSGFAAGAVAVVASYLNGAPLPPEVYAFGPVLVGWASSKALRWWRGREVVTRELVKQLARLELVRIIREQPEDLKVLVDQERK